MASDITSKIYDPDIEDIRSKFAYLHKILDQKEEMLIANIMDKKVYDSKGCMSQIEDLMAMNEFIKENTKNNALRGGKLFANEQEIAQLKSEMLADNQLEPITWGQMCYDDLCKVLDKIEFGVQENQLVKTLNDRSKYSNKVCAIYQGGKTGKSSSDQLSHANHIAIDESTQYIYVSDFQQNSIIVFDNKANIISTISLGIKFPRAITCRNNKLYLIENLHSMRHVEFKSFSLTPKVSQIPSTKMKIPADLSHISAFDVSKDGNWYVCSRRANKVFFLKDSTFYLINSKVPFQSPTAVKAYEVLYLLECLSDGTSRIRLMDLKVGETMDFIALDGIVEPMYFDVDIDHSFILSITDQDTIVMFSRESGVIHKIQSSKFQCVSRPKGIAVTRDGNVVVITNNSNGCLLVF